MRHQAIGRLFGMVCILHALCGTAAPVVVPNELEQWRGWVLQDEDYRQCPYVASEHASERDAFLCAWPGRLVLTVEPHGGTFSQRWQLFAETWVRLPGNVEHWPQDVRVDGHPAAVVLREEAPQLRLPRGSHDISGRLTFAVRPELLEVDARTAMIALTLDGRPVAQPERPDGAVWLGKRRTAEQPQRTDVQVYRLVQDELPVRLVTLIRLKVSGEGREELLSHVLPAGFVPLSLDSQLPARLDSDGQLRMQVRAGSWDITVTARGASVATRLVRPKSQAPWPSEEVWSFAGDDQLRVAAAQGVDGIDPAQAGVPADWSQYPAFRMLPDSALSIDERARGLQHSDDNRLSLTREVWLDFDHGGLTAVDRINGTMRSQWRLEMTAPFRLESARAGEQPLLVTRNREGPGTGVELRRPELSLVTTSRIEPGGSALPATGWNTRFERVSGQLNLPPGHRLLAGIGVDQTPEAWFDKWGLWGVFGVLVVAVFAGWLAGWPIGVVALAGLVLMYQEAPGYIWLWSNVIAAVALARAAPEGRLRRVANRYRAFSFVVLGTALLPLLWGEIRVAFYPQLEQSQLFGGLEPVGGTATYAAAMATATVDNPYGLNARWETSALPSHLFGKMPQPRAPDIRTAVSAGTTAAQLPAPSAVLEETVVTAQRRTLQEPLRREAPQTAHLELPKEVAGRVSDARYAAGTLLQTGPGIPGWHFQTYSFWWSGPVEAGQSVRFLYIGPVLLGIWRVAGAVLLAFLFLALLRPEVRDVLNRWPRGRAAANTLVSGVILLVAATATPIARASTTVVDPAILEELKARLTRLPDCSPTCADVTSAAVTVRGEQLDVDVLVSALTTIAVPVPSAGDRWHVESVRVDGQSELPITREEDGTLWVPLTAGVHTVRLSGKLAPARSIQLAFPAIPHRVSVTSDGWDVAGVNEEQRLLSGSLELVRRRSRDAGSEASDPLEAPSEFPPFVEVSRQIDLGLDWSITTTVTRVAPATAALSTEVPLLPHESVLTQTLQTRVLPDGRQMALIGLERGESERVWTSSLARADTLDLELPQGSARSEVWNFVVHPQWDVTFEGQPAVLPKDLRSPSWVYEFHPRPGEKLRVHVARPEAAQGATLAIDSVNQRLVFGKRSSDTTLTLAYRTTQGGRHTIHVPETVRVTSVMLDGKPVQLRPDRGELPLSLLPGSHSVVVDWTAPEGAGVTARPLPIDLRTTASNVITSVELPEDRWPLFAAGAGVGPAVLYWGELVIFLVTAWLVGRWAKSPLRTHEWVLLGLGLSTLSWFVLALVALWLFAMRWREAWTADGVSRWRFNLVQVSLAALTVLATASLIFIGIRNSLLAAPSMGVAGLGSWDYTFTWFQDQTPSELPRPVVVSAPLWVYRGLMFAWALWIAVALLRWLRFAWRGWKANGIWRGKVIATPEVPAAPAA